MKNAGKNKSVAFIILVSVESKMDSNRAKRMKNKVVLYLPCPCSLSRTSDQQEGIYLLPVSCRC